MAISPLGTDTSIHDAPASAVMRALAVPMPRACAAPDADAFVYVLEGSIVMGLNGGKEVTLGPGQVFHEGPDDVHTVGRNASNTAPAKFVVFLLKDRNKPVLVPVH